MSTLIPHFLDKRLKAPLTLLLELLARCLINPGWGRLKDFSTNIKKSLKNTHLVLFKSRAKISNSKDNRDFNHGAKKWGFKIRRDRDLTAYLRNFRLVYSYNYHN